MKKNLKLVLGAFVAVGAAASVHAAAYGGVVTNYGGGTPVNPNPTFYGNCTAMLQRYDYGGPNGGPDFSYVAAWTTVSAPSPAQCEAIVNSYLNATSGGVWRVSSHTPRCACSSPAMGRILDLGVDSVSWTAAQDAALDVELEELKAEYRIDEYHDRVRQLVEERIQ